MKNKHTNHPVLYDVRSFNIKYTQLKWICKGA